MEMLSLKRLQLALVCWLATFVAQPAEALRWWRVRWYSATSQYMYHDGYGWRFLTKEEEESLKKALSKQPAKAQFIFACTGWMDFLEPPVWDPVTQSWVVPAPSTSCSHSVAKPLWDERKEKRERSSSSSSSSSSESGNSERYVNLRSRSSCREPGRGSQEWRDGSWRDDAWSSQEWQDDSWDDNWSSQQWQDNSWHWNSQQWHDDSSHSWDSQWDGSQQWQDSSWSSQQWQNPYSKQSQKWQCRVWVAEPSLPSHEGDRDPGGQPQGPTRGIIRGENPSNKRKEIRALQREGKPVPPWLQALKVPSLNKAENMERRKLQEQLQSLERQYNSAKSWEEQKKSGMIYWKQSTA